MVGIDVTNVERLRRVLERYPGAEERFFTETERRHCRSHSDPVTHFAGTFAAKEAVVKALGLGSIRAWARRIEITRDETGAPGARVLERSRGEIELSISHDGDVAVAVAIRTASSPGGKHRRTASPARASEAREGIDQARPPGTGDPAASGHLERFLGPYRGRALVPRAPALTALSDCGWGSDFP